MRAKLEISFCGSGPGIYLSTKIMASFGNFKRVYGSHKYTMFLIFIFFMGNSGSPRHIKHFIDIFTRFSRTFDTPISIVTRSEQLLGAP